MSDSKLTKDKMRTFDGHEKVGMLKAGEKLTEFGEKQNIANEAMALNINDLIKRVCLLEDKQLENEKKFKELDEQQKKLTEAIMKIASELKNEINETKKELDRVRLTEKLNSGAIERLDKARRLAEGDTENR